MPDLPVEIISPHAVTEGALLSTIDIIRPRIQATNPDRIVFNAGVEIGSPLHLGNSVTFASAFLLAKTAKVAFDADVSVLIHVLDNAPLTFREDLKSHHLYQQTHYHALGAQVVSRVIEERFRGIFNSLAKATGIEYELRTFTSQQSGSSFRLEFLNSLSHLDSLRWSLAPSFGRVPMRFPCPQCGWAEKFGESVRLLTADFDRAVFASHCIDHGTYEVTVTPVSNTYIDLDTLYRNFVKERVAVRDPSSLSVMVKGSDWVQGCQLVDLAFARLVGPPPPPRIFTPMVLSETGSKLSKSVISSGAASSLSDSAAWMFDASHWEGTSDEYADAVLWLVSSMLLKPQHFFRSYTTVELGRLFSNRQTGIYQAVERGWEADPAAQFKRRWGKASSELDPSVTGSGSSCPDIWELDNGDIAVVGRDLTSAYADALPEGVTVYHDERLVVIPRSLIIAAKQDIPEV